MSAPNAGYLVNLGPGRSRSLSPCAPAMCPLLRGPVGGVHQPAEGTSVQLLTVPASLFDQRQRF